MKLRPVIIISLLIFNFSCVDQIDVDTPVSNPILVIEGHIGTIPNSYEIKLSKTARYGNAAIGFVAAETRAEVVIRDSDGETTFLTEQNDGSYFTPNNFSADLSKTYTLLITTAQGEKYTSIPEKAVEGPEIQELQVNYKEKPFINNIGELENATGFEVYVKFEDNATENNIYFISYRGTYFITTQPEDFTIVNTGPGPRLIPAPKDCCAECFIHENPQANFKLTNDDFYNGQNTTQFVGFIENDGLRFQDKYFIIVSLRTITPEAFSFYKKIRQQLDLSGDIFDPPPSTVQGNIYNETNPSENVIGYFSVSDLKTDSLFLNKTELQTTVLDRRIPDDCRVLKNATTVKPIYWD